jgi:transposase
MIPVPSGVRVWLAVGRTDMRRGMNGLALQVQEALRRDPHAGDLYVFRGARGDLIKIIWHDGLGMSLYAKRLEKGRFIWPSPADGVVGISASQLAYMLEESIVQSASYVSSGMCRIVHDAFLSRRQDCDSIWSWIGW